MRHHVSNTGPAPPFVCLRTRGAVDVGWVHIAGALDDARAVQLKRTLRERGLRTRLVVLDLRELTFIDCAGVHAIVNASLRARQDGRRLVLVRGRPDIYRMFTLMGSSADVDIGDLEPVQPAAHALQRSLVSQSLLRTGGTAGGRRPSH